MERGVALAAPTRGMGETASGRLRDGYRVDPAKVQVVPHGASAGLGGPSLANGSRPVVLTWGLIGPGKGLEMAIDAFTGHLLIDAVLVVIHRDDEALHRQILNDHEKLLPPVFGGDTRQVSVLAGLERLEQMQQVPDQVLIHDRVRPFVCADLVQPICAPIWPTPV